MTGGEGGRTFGTLPDMTVEDSAAVASVREPGQLISSVPALLGFVPARSLVVVCLRSAGSVTTAGPVIRQDLPEHADHREACAAVIASICEREHVRRAVLIVIDDRVSNSLDHGPTVDAVTADLAVHGCLVRGSYFTPEIAAGMPWCEIAGTVAVEDPARWSAGNHRCGVLPDPGTSDLALMRVISGMPVAPDRAALEEALRPVASSRRREVRRALAGHRGHRDSRAAWAVVQAAVRDVAAPDGAELGADRIADLAVALRDVRVRDAALGAGSLGADGAVARAADHCASHHCASDHCAADHCACDYCASPDDGPGAVERLWIAQGRHLEGGDRATALTLAGYCAHLRGDGAFAATAYAVALAADPAHRLAHLLDNAAGVGMPPRDLRRLALLAERIARDLEDPLPAGP